MIIRVLVWFLVAYLAYKFLFDFLIPIITVARRMKRQVKDFNQQQQQQQGGQSANGNKNSTPPKEKAGDYIDFEDV